MFKSSPEFLLSQGRDMYYLLEFRDGYITIYRFPVSIKIIYGFSEYEPASVQLIRWKDPWLLSVHRQGKRGQPGLHS